MDNILEPKPPKNFHSIEERCEDLRSQLVGYTIRYLKRLKEWTDEQITEVDIIVEPYNHNKSIKCTVTIIADTDTKTLLCDLLTGVLYTQGYLACSGFELGFPDKVECIIEKF